MEKIYSIEDGFQIVMLFLQDFWVDFLKQQMISENLIDEDFEMKISPERPAVEQLKNDLHSLNWYFFAIVCDGTSSDYFEVVLENRVHIPPPQQPGMQVDQELLFQLMLDFAEFVNKRFNVDMEDSLKFAINWLEEMRKHPEEHLTEWKIWDDVVIKVTKHGARSMGFF